MNKMVLGVFSDRDLVESAIEHLEDSGFKTKDISLIMKDHEEGEKLASDTGTSVAEGAASGAVTGGVLGGLAGLLIGIGAIPVVGIGALLIGGPLAAALGLTGLAATTASGVATGALAGGLIGALMGLGVSEEDAKYYEDSIRDGGILVVVPVLDLAEEDEVSSIMEDHGAKQIRSVNAKDSYRREEVGEYPAAYYNEVTRANGDDSEEEEEKKKEKKYSRR